jgi:hypothetical protein
MRPSWLLFMKPPIEPPAAAFNRRPPVAALITWLNAIMAQPQGMTTRGAAEDKSDDCDVRNPFL